MSRFFLALCLALASSPFIVAADPSRLVYAVPCKPIDAQMFAVVTGEAGRRTLALYQGREFEAGVTEFMLEETAPSRFCGDSMVQSGCLSVLIMPDYIRMLPVGGGMDEVEITLGRCPD